MRSEGEIEQFHAQALHHHILHEATRGGGLLEAVGTRLEVEGARRDGEDRDIVAVTELDHVAIRIVEEHLVHLVPFVFHHCCHIPHPHLLQPPLHFPNVPTLPNTSTQN